MLSPIKESQRIKNFTSILGNYFLNQLFHLAVKTLICSLHLETTLAIILSHIIITLMEQYSIDFQPVLEQIANKITSLTELKEKKRSDKLLRKKNMSGFIDLATFDDLEKYAEKIELAVEETIAESEDIIMNCIEPMIIAELVILAAPILAPVIALAPILAPVVISLATWEADEKLKETLQTLIHKSKKRVSKK